jgi:hypothetical protein
MLVQDLPEDADLGSVLLRVPDNFLATMRSHAGGEPEMYLVSCGIVSWFSPDPPTSKKRRLYPTLPHWDVGKILTWEVVNV